MRAPAFDVAAPAAATAGAPLRRPAGRGRPLDPAVRERMATAFGTGFDSVRVHTDGASDAFNREVSASASTLGDHIYFRSGAYQPGTGAGQRLLAHELTHVVQQRGSTAVAPRLGPIGGTAEAQADAAAARVAAGGSIDPGALAPVAAGTVQRRYLETGSPSAAVGQFRTDTSRDKKGVAVSRGKLRHVDQLLRAAMVLGPASPGWLDALAALDAALAATKYATAGKNSRTFRKRRRAVELLRLEIANRRAPTVPQPPLPQHPPPAYPPPPPPLVPAPAQAHVPPPVQEPAHLLPPQIQVHGHQMVPLQVQALLPDVVDLLAEVQQLPQAPKTLPQINVQAPPLQVPVASPSLGVDELLAQVQQLPQTLPAVQALPTVQAQLALQAQPILQAQPAVVPTVHATPQVQPTVLPTLQAHPQGPPPELGPRSELDELQALVKPLPNEPLKQVRVMLAGQQPDASQTEAMAITFHAAGYLQNVGFAFAFLENCYPLEINSLYHASLALSAHNWSRAQQVFDMLNPPSAPTNQKLPKGWRPDGFDMVSPEKVFDIKRSRSDMLAAQRQLMVAHAEDIGGLYAELMRYKPYSPKKGGTPLTTAQSKEGERFYRKEELRDWGSLITWGAKQQAPLLLAIGWYAEFEAGSYDKASAVRQQQKGLPPKPARPALEPAEVAALRIYTSDEYREINSVLRDYRFDNPTANWWKYSAIARLAISGMYKLPKVRDNTVSYRGDDDFLHSGYNLLMRAGTRFRAPNFYSTTRYASSAFPGALGYVFINRTSARDVSAFSAYPGEGEILIPPGTNFWIEEEWWVDQQTDTWYSAHGAVGLAGPAAALDGPLLPKRKNILVFREIG